MQLSLRFKTIVGIALIEAVLLTLLITLGLGYLRDTSHAEMHKRAETTARLFAATTKDAVLSLDLASLEAFCKELLHNPDVLYVRLTDANGAVLAQNGSPEYLSQPFIEDRSVIEVEDGSFDRSAPIREAGTLFGQVELGLDIRPLSIQIAEATTWSYLIAAGEMLLVALFSFILGSYLTRRLAILAQAARTISAGQRSIQLEISTQDEVGTVAEAFNEMSAELEKADLQRDQYETQLKLLNSELEQRVSRRTHKLSEKNRELEATNIQLQRTQQQLVQSQKMASLGIMAAGMAHEINNPIGVVKSNLQALDEYMEEYNTLISKIEQEGSQPLKTWLEQQEFGFIQQDICELSKSNKQATQRIIAIINGLREFAQQHSPEAAEKQPLNPLLIQHCQQQLEKESSQSSLRFELKETESICNQGERVAQSLARLINNAIKAGASKIQIRSQLTEQQIKLSVIDNGKGIAKPDLPLVFDPFFTRWPVGEGAGLGLAIVYNSMQELEGEIAIESREGKGTVATLCFPLS